MNKSLLAVVAVLFINFIGFGMIIPVIPQMIQETSPLTIHYFLLLSLYSFAGLIMSPFWGNWSDRIGRKPIILIGLIGFAVSFLLFGLAKDHLLLMYISRIMGGFFSGAATACALAAVTDLSNEEQRTRSLGMAGMAIGLGFVFGPAIGASLSLLGLTVPFFFAAAFAIVNALYVWKKVPETNQRIGEAAPKMSFSEKWLAIRGPIKYLFLLSFLVTYTLSSIESTLYYFALERFQITPFSFGMMLLVTGLVGAAVQGGVVRRFVKPGTEQRTIQFGLILCAIGFLLLLSSQSILEATIYLCIFGSGNALIRPCVISLITQKSGLQPGLATGLSSSMDSLGRIAGPLLSGALFQFHSNAPYVVGGIMCVLSLLALARFQITFTRHHEVSPGSITD